MNFVADLHLHSKYSRAVSQAMVLPEMAKWASTKGIDILSAADFTHPLWLRELKIQLEEASEGLYALKSQADKQKQPLFLLSTEIASIYKQGDKLRRIHNLVFAPSIETVEKINGELTRRACNLLSDGRPIIGLSSANLLEMLLSIDPKIILIPCHVWTPHFGVYGSASGFDSISEAFGDFSRYIYGIETGLSSDPQMNWQMEELKNRSILSFSDAHSTPKMGREATVFVSNSNRGPVGSPSTPATPRVDISYNDIAAAIKREKSSDFRIGYTIEFYPEEGKYHFSGHRNCKVTRGPDQTRQDGNICPVCSKRLTEGVLYRVEQLSEGQLEGNMEAKISANGIKWYTDPTKNHPPFVKLVPLLEVIAEAFSSTPSSQKTNTAFVNLCETLGSEIDVLLKAPIQEIEKLTGPRVAEGVEKVRKGDIVIDPGYDGEYGKVKIWNEEKNQKTEDQDSKKAQLGLQF
ncbi:MAG: endonuclease Q family protein [Patescibacteria group bacterium]|nr:endonuclease Q family protein [Patescibacteria group bacterium]